MAGSRDRRREAKQEKLKRRADKEDPFLEFSFDPIALLAVGPIIKTDLTVTESHAVALKAAGLPIPPKVNCRWLIDTGADGCVVKHQIAETAGLKLINSHRPLQGVGVDTSGKVYVGRIVFGIESRTAPGVRHLLAVDTEITSGQLVSERIDGIIGRSVLAAWEFRYNGRTGRVTMRFLRG